MQRLLPVLIVCALTSFAGSTPDFQDSLVLKDGKTAGGGVVSNTVANDGDALKFTGKGFITYTNFNLDPKGGALSLKVRLDFDPKEKNERTKDVLRNQIFVRIERPDGHYAILYSCLTDVRFGVTRMPGHESLFNTGMLYNIEKGKWVEVKLSWGAKFQMEIDGNKVPEQAWEGLFGNLPPAPNFTVSLGLPPGRGLENEFSLKDFFVTGGRSGSEQLAALPLNKEPAPTIDGKLDEPFWGKCTLLDGFSVYEKERLVSERTDAQVCYTDTGVYVGVTAVMPGGRPAQGVLAKRDDALYTEDAVEVRFVGTDGAIYVFLVNPAGTKYDAKVVGLDAGTAYNPEWQAACTQEAGVWATEVFLPYAALGLAGMPAAGFRMLGNVSVDVGGCMLSRAWRPALNYNSPAQMGTFLFTGSSQGMRLKLRDFLTGQPKVDFVKTGSLMPATNLTALLTDAGGKEVSAYKFFMHDGPTATYTGGNLGPGTHLLKVSAVNEDGLPLLAQRLYFDPEVNTRLEVENYPYGGTAKLLASFPPVFQGEKVAAVAFALLDSGRKPLSTVPGTMAGAGGSATAQLPTATLAPGAYHVKATLAGAGGKELDSVLADFRIFSKPVWWKNTLGVNHTVPPPWTPVEKLANGLGVWNRAYLFDGKIFPTQVMNGTDKLFTAPPSFRLLLADGATDLFALPEASRESFPDEVTMKAAKGAVTIAAKLEFDGCLRVDLEVQQSTVIKELALELPVADMFAKFLLSGSDTSTGVNRLTASRDLPFAPYFWLGDYAGGVALFFESDEFFTPNNPKAFQLIQGPGGYVLKVNIITAAITPARPLKLTFGLMATPVRENKIRDPFAYSPWKPIIRGLPKISRPEYLRYGRLTGLPADRGTIEFFFQRDLAAKKADSALFALSRMPMRNETLAARIDNAGNVALFYNAKELCKSPSTVAADKWNHLELSFADGQLRLFVNGDLLGTVQAPQRVAALWKDISAGDAVFDIGAYGQFYPDNCDLMVDDVRVSRTALHLTGFTPSAGPLERTADTLVLDTLEESFRPDGFTGFTAAGGLPSIGSAFVSGRSGKGLRIVTEPLTDTLDVENRMQTNMELFWGWHIPNVDSESDWPPYFTFTVDPKLAAMVAKTNALKRLSMFYVLFPAIGEPSDLAAQFGDEWSIRPRTALPYAPPAGHKMLMIATGAPGYADYMAYGVKWLMDNYQLKAIYTDGACQPARTSNAAYGQGWVDARGNRHSTYPFFATRETIKRVYKVIKENNPAGVLMNHLSFSTPMPILSFSDILYTGEHEDYTDITTSSFRFNGKPWGPFTFILGASGSHWSAFHTAAGLLNGTTIFGTTIDGRNDMARKTLRVRDIYESVNFLSAEFFPWYKAENNLATCADRNVHTAAYVHKGKVALLIVANYSATPVTASVKLDLEAFGFAGRPPKATNALLETTLPLAGDTLEVPLLPSNFTLVKLRVD